MATDAEEKKRDAMVAVLKEEFNAMKKKVTMDNYYVTRAETMVLSNEIEKYLIKASVEAISTEHDALANCFLKGIPHI